MNFEVEYLKVNKENKMKNINWHTVRTLSLLCLSFVVAGLQSVKGMTAFDAKIDMALPILLMIEHVIAGNSDLKVN